MNGCMKKTVWSALLAVCGGICFVFGCGGQHQGKTLEQVCIPNLEKARAMALTEDVLNRMHFTVAKVDAAEGVVITRPLQGAQFFEFWREDNVGRFNSAEANIHTIRRTAHLDMTEGAGQVCINCIVKTEKLNMPERQFSNSAEAYKMYALTSRSRQKLKLEAKQQSWGDMGPDLLLATRILERIQERAAVSQ